MESIYWLMIWSRYFPQQASHVKKLALDGTHGFQMTLVRKGIELPSSKATYRLNKKSIIPWIYPHYPVIYLFTILSCSLEKNYSRSSNFQLFKCLGKQWFQWYFSPVWFHIFATWALFDKAKAYKKEEKTHKGSFLHH